MAKKEIDLKKINRLLDKTTSFSHALGKITGVLGIAIMLVVTYETGVRYIFNSPSLWAWTIVRFLFAILSLSGIAYACTVGGHLRMEVLYVHLSKKTKKVLNWISFICFLIFAGVLLWQFTVMGIDSLMAKTMTTTAFRIPVYPLKLFLPVLVLWFLVQGIVNFIRKGDTIYDVEKEEN